MPENTIDPKTIVPTPEKTPVSETVPAEPTVKRWYESKTIWVNTIALIALVTESAYGFSVPVETQGALLIVANLILRAITSEEIQ